MRKLYTSLLAIFMPLAVMGQGWPADYPGVMLQAFYYENVDHAAKWNGKNEPYFWQPLEERSDELSRYFDLIWVINSGSLQEEDRKDVGYIPIYMLKHNTIFGTQQQLMSMIRTYKAKGTGIIEDVVLNHKGGLTNWADFPSETAVGTQEGNLGKEYCVTWCDDMKNLWGIAKDDEVFLLHSESYTYDGRTVNGPAANVSDSERFYICSPDANKDSYETGGYQDGGYARDLDHLDARVQENVMTYLDYLTEELGYSGFRYDVVKGYSGAVLGKYNLHARPTFSVGEYWNGDVSNLTNWLNKTATNASDGSIQSAVFDFTCKYKLDEAFNNGNFQALTSSTFVSRTSGGKYKRYAVTFAENHDTTRGSDRLTNSWSAANALILGLPGTPCVFIEHYEADKTNIQNMILARRAAGVCNTSDLVASEGSATGYTATTQGKNCKVCIQLGDKVTTTLDGYTRIAYSNSEKHYAFWIENVCADKLTDNNYNKPGLGYGYAIVSQPAGTYVQSVSVTVSASDADTELVYTTDGSQPTAASSKIGKGASKTFAFTNTTTLKVGVLNGSKVRDVVAYKYTITAQEKTGLTVYVKADTENLGLHAWEEGGADLNGAWDDGQVLQEQAVVRGELWSYKHFENTNKSTINLMLHIRSDNTKAPNRVSIRPDQHEVFLKYNGTDADFSDVTDDYVGYPVCWVEPGERCAYVAIPTSNLGDTKKVYAYAWTGGGSNVTLFSDGWPGTEITASCLGYVPTSGKATGKKLYKWTCSSERESFPENIIFDIDKTPKTDDLTFKNGGYYDFVTNAGTLSPTDYTTSELPLYSLPATTETDLKANWNLEEMHLAKADGSTVTKELYLQKGTYTAQAVVRGTDGGQVTIDFGGASTTTDVSGLSDGSESTVGVAGWVDDVVTGTNNGWRKVQATYVLAADGKVTLALSSTAADWEIGAVRVLESTDTDGHYQTMGTTDYTQTLADEASQALFSFYERGANKNALVKARADQPIANMPCNVIVDGVCNHLVLTDGKYDFNAATAFTAKQIDYDRAFSSEVTSTICLPFALTAEETAALHGTLYTFTGHDAEGFHFQRVAVLEANTPYVFVPAASEAAFVQLAERLIPASSLKETTTGSMTFCGTMTWKQIRSEEDGVTYYGYNESTGEFVQVGTESGARVKPFRAYLKADAPVAGATMGLVLNDEVVETTPVDAVAELVPARRSGAVYSVSGRLLRRNGRVKDLPKGVYISDGRKFVVK